MKRGNPNELKAMIDQSTDSSKPGLEEKLGSVLVSLKQTLNIGYELKVKWVPNGDGRLSGQVKGDCICIYEENEDKALRTLIHEFLDYAISNVIEPYKQVTNKLITLINEEAYKRKEKLVEILTELSVDSIIIAV